jgi:hypothetical protein
MQQKKKVTFPYSANFNEHILKAESSDNYHESKVVSIERPSFGIELLIFYL